MSVDAGPSDDSDAGAAATASSGVCLPEAIAAGTAAAATGGLTGGPCEADDQCIDGGFCFSDAWLDDLGEQFGLDTSPFDIPGGMCSAFCFGADDCEPGSACLPLQDTFGAPFDLCVRRCGDLDACRWEEGYQCYLADPDDDLAVCLPETLVIAAECDDGHCEEGG